MMKLFHLLFLFLVLLVLSIQLNLHNSSQPYLNLHNSQQPYLNLQLTLPSQNRFQKDPLQSYTQPPTNLQYHQKQQSTYHKQINQQTNANYKHIEHNINVIHKITYNRQSYKEYRFFSRIRSIQISRRFQFAKNLQMLRVLEISKKMTFYQEWIHFRLEQVTIDHKASIVLQFPSSPNFKMIDSFFPRNGKPSNTISRLIESKLKDCEINSIFDFDNAQFKFHRSEINLDHQLFLFKLNVKDKKKESCIRFLQKYQAIGLVQSSYMLLNLYASQDYYQNYLYRQFQQNSFESVMILSCNSKICEIKLCLHVESSLQLQNYPELIIPNKYKDLKQLLNKILVSNNKPPSDIFNSYENQNLSGPEKNYLQDVLQMSSHIKLAEFDVRDKQKFIKNQQIELKLSYLKKQDKYSGQLETVLIANAMGSRIKVYSMTRQIFKVFDSLYQYYDQDDLNIQNKVVSLQLTGEEVQELPGPIKYGYSKGYIHKNMKSKQNYWCFTFQWIYIVRIKVAPPVYPPPPIIFCDEDDQSTFMFCKMNCIRALYLFQKFRLPQYQSKLIECCETGDLKSRKEYFDCCTLKNSFDSCDCKYMIRELYPAEGQELSMDVHQRMKSIRFKTQTIIDHCCIQIKQIISQSQELLVSKGYDIQRTTQFMNNECGLGCTDDYYFQNQIEQCCEFQIFRYKLEFQQVPIKKYKLCCDKFPEQLSCDCEQIIRSDQFPIQTKVEECCSTMLGVLIEEINERSNLNYILDYEFMVSFFNRCGGQRDICEHESQRMTKLCCEQRLMIDDPKSADFWRTVYECCPAFDNEFEQCNRNCLTVYTYDEKCCNQYIQIKKLLQTRLPDKTDALQLYFEIGIANHCCEDQQNDPVCNCETILKSYGISYEAAVNKMVDSKDLEKQLGKLGEGIKDHHYEKMIQSYRDCFCQQEVSSIGIEEYYKHCCFEQDSLELIITRNQCCDQQLARAKTIEQYSQVYYRCCSQEQKYSGQCGCINQIKNKYSEVMVRVIQDCCDQIIPEDIQQDQSLVILYQQQCCQDKQLFTLECCDNLYKYDARFKERDYCCDRFGLQLGWCRSCENEQYFIMNGQFCCQQFFEFVSSEGTTNFQSGDLTYQFLQNKCCNEFDKEQQQPICEISCDDIVGRFYDQISDKLEQLDRQNPAIIDQIKNMGRMQILPKFRFKAQYYHKNGKVPVINNSIQNNRNINYTRRFKKLSRDEMVQSWLSRRSNFQKAVTQCCVDFIQKGINVDKNYDRFIDICGYSCDREIESKIIVNKHCCLEFLEKWFYQVNSADLDQFYSIYGNCCKEIDRDQIEIEQYRQIYDDVCGPKDKPECQYFSERGHFNEQCCEQYYTSAISGVISRYVYVLMCFDKKQNCDSLVKTYIRGSDELKAKLQHIVRNECCHKPDLRIKFRETCDRFCDEEKGSNCYGCDEFMGLLGLQVQGGVRVSTQISENTNMNIQYLVNIYTGSQKLYSERSKQMIAQKKMFQEVEAINYIQMQKEYFRKLETKIADKNIGLDDFKIQPLELWRLCCFSGSVSEQKKEYCECSQILGKPDIYPPEIVQYCCSNSPELYIKFYIKLRDICVKDCEQYPLHPECCVETFQKQGLNQNDQQIGNQLEQLSRIETRKKMYYSQIVNQDISSQIVSYHKEFIDLAVDDYSMNLVYFIQYCCHSFDSELKCDRSNCYTNQNTDKLECCDIYLKHEQEEFYFFSKDGWELTQKQELIRSCCDQYIANFNQYDVETRAMIKKVCSFDLMNCEDEEYFKSYTTQCCEDYRTQFVKEKDRYIVSRLGNLENQLLMKMCCDLYMNHGIKGLPEIAKINNDYGFSSKLELYEGGSYFYQVEVYYVQDMCCQYYGYDQFDGQCQLMMGGGKLVVNDLDCGLIMKTIMFRYSPAYVYCCIQIYGYRYCVEKQKPNPPDNPPKTTDCPDFCYTTNYQHYICKLMGCYFPIIINQNCLVFLKQLYQLDGQNKEIQLYHYINRQQMICCLNMFYSGEQSRDRDIYKNCCNFMQQFDEQYYKKYCENDCSIYSIKTYQDLSACCNQAGISESVKKMCDCRLDFYNMFSSIQSKRQLDIVMNYFYEQCCDQLLPLQPFQPVLYDQFKQKCDCNSVFKKLKQQQDNMESQSLDRKLIQKCCDDQYISEQVKQKYCDTDCLQNFSKLRPTQQYMCCLTNGENDKVPCDCSLLEKTSPQYFKDFCCLVKKKDSELCRDQNTDPCDLDEIEELLQQNDYFQKSDIRRLKKHKENKCKRFKKQSNNRHLIPGFLKIKTI